MLCEFSNYLELETKKRCLYEMGVYQFSMVERLPKDYCILRTVKHTYA